MASAIALYELYADMDAADYTETYESDIKFIETLILELGYQDAKAILATLTA
jgi:hypothetical protein